jgi:hypothetical protein
MGNRKKTNSRRNISGHIICPQSNFSKERNRGEHRRYLMFPTKQQAWLMKYFEDLQLKRLIRNDQVEGRGGFLPRPS